MKYESRLTPEMAAEFAKSGYWTDQTLAGLVADRARTHGDRVALVDDKSRVTYAQLFNAAQNVALRLTHAGIREGDVVSVQIENSLEFVAIMVGAHYSGAVASQISVDFRGAEVLPILKLCESRAYISNVEHKGFDLGGMAIELSSSLPNLAIIGHVGEGGASGSVRFDENVWESPAAPVPPGLADANTITRMAFTSGTTGHPKGVLHSSNSILSACRICNQDMGITEQDVLLLYLPVGLTWGYLVLLMSIQAGATAVLTRSFDAERALALIEKERATYVPTAPASLVSILNLSKINRFDLSSLRMMVSGGTSCPLEIIRLTREKLGAAVIESYGMVETGFHTYTKPTDTPEIVHGTVGKVATGMGVRLIDEHGDDVEVGMSGEIAAIGPSVHLGYFRNPQANEAAFTKNGWFRTGDVGIFDDNGNLKIVGRIKEIINRGGLKFFPREVEEILYTHPKILHAAIVGVPDPRLGERACLCVVAKDEDNRITLDEVIDFLRNRIATYKLPERLVHFCHLPMTASGKVQRHRLSNLVVERIGR